MTASERFEIYRSGYHARLLECLLDDYPVLAAMIGEDRFEALCRAYVDRLPSASPNLNGFGRHMASFCREVGLGESFTALRVFASSSPRSSGRSSRCSTPSALPRSRWPRSSPSPPDAWARARFIKSEALQIHRFEYPVNAVFIANRIEEIIPEVPGPSPNAVAVYRRRCSSGAWT